jgi:hypothetical protein
LEVLRIETLEQATGIYLLLSNTTNY